MTPSERERRIEAAVDALCAREALPDQLVNRIHAKVALDAADEAVPMVSQADSERAFEQAMGLLVPHLERAEAAARDLANALGEIIVSSPKRHVDIAYEARARYPSFSGEEGTEG